MPGSRDFPKYVEAERFLKLNIRRAQDLGLDRMPPAHSRSWFGRWIFLFVTRVLGHSGLGIDLDNYPLFREMFELFGLRRLIHRIEKFSALPETGARYDWITAFSIAFSGPLQPTPWGSRGVGLFLQDARRHLVPGGRIYLDLNPDP